MERTALRPRPLPGRNPAADRTDEPDPGQSPPAARPRRLTSALCGLCAGLVCWWRAPVWAPPAPRWSA